MVVLIWGGDIVHLLHWLSRGWSGDVAVGRGVVLTRLVGKLLHQTGRGGTNHLGRGGHGTVVDTNSTVLARRRPGAGAEFLLTGV